MQCCMRLPAAAPSPAPVCYHATPEAMCSGRTGTSSRNVSSQVQKPRCSHRLCQLHALVAKAAAQPQAAYNDSTITSYGGHSLRGPATGRATGLSTEQYVVTTPRLLTARLSSAPNCSAVLQLLQCNTQLLNAIHVSAALVRAVKLQGLQAGKLSRQQHSKNSSRTLAQDRELDALIMLCEAALLGTAEAAETTATSCTGPQGLLAACGVRELANICWALAKLGKGQAFAPHAIEAVLNLSQQGTAQAGVQHSPQHIAPQRHAEACTDGKTYGISKGNGVAALHSDGAVPNSHAPTTGWSAASGSNQIGTPQQSNSYGPHFTLRKARIRRHALYEATPQALTNLFWAFAHWFAGCGSDAVGGTSSRDALIQTSDSSTGAATTGWYTQPSSHGNNGTAQPANTPGNSSSSSIEGVSAAAWLWYHGSSLAAVHSALEALCGAMLYNLHRASPQDLALTVWSLATLRFTPSRCALMPALIDAISSSLPEQTSQGMSSITWGLAKLQTSQRSCRRDAMRQSWDLPESAARALMDHALQLLPALASQPTEAAMLMQGLAAMGSRRQALWRGMQEQVAQAGVQYWPPGCISNLLSAYATAKRPCGHVVAALYHSLRAHAVAPDATGTIITTQDSPGIQIPMPGGSAQPAAYSVDAQQQQQPSLLRLSTWQDQELLTAAWALATLYKATIKALQSPKGPLQDTKQHDNGQGQQLSTDQAMDAIPGCLFNNMGIMRDIVQHLLQEVTVRLQQGRLPPASVATAYWVSTTCNLQDNQLHTACINHAATHLDQYPASYIAAMLQCPPPQHSHAPGARQEAGPSGAVQQSVAFQEAQARLWTAFMDVAPSWLPHMMHTQLAAVCEAAVQRWGTAPKRLVNKVLQLVLGAVVLRAQRLRQQHLEQTGGVMSRNHSLQPPSPSSLQQRVQLSGSKQPPASLSQLQQQQQQQGPQLGASKDDGWTAVTDDNRVRETRKYMQADESRHMPTPATIATLMWVLTCSGYSSTMLFQLAVVVMGGADGSSRLSPQQACRMLWACAHANLYSGPLYAQLCGHLGVHLGSLTQDALCEVLGLIAGSRHYEPLLVRAACMQLQRHEHHLGPQRAAGLMWSIAYMSAGTLLEWRPPLTHLCRLVPEMCMEAHVLTLWAIAVQQHVLLGSSRRPASSSSSSSSSSRSDVHTPRVGLVQAQADGATALGSDRQACEADSVSLEDGASPSPEHHTAGTSAQENTTVAVAASEVSQAAVPAGRTARAQHQAQPRHGSDAFRLLCTLLQQLHTVDEQAVIQHPYAGMLLGQALSWLLASSRQEVKAAASECVLAWPVSLRTHIQMCLLTSAPSDTMLSGMTMGQYMTADSSQGIQAASQPATPQEGGMGTQLASEPQWDRSGGLRKAVGHTRAAREPQPPASDLASDVAGETTPSGGSGAGRASGRASECTLHTDLLWYMQATVFGRGNTSTAIRARQRLFKQLVQALQQLGLQVAPSSRLEVAHGRAAGATPADLQQAKDSAGCDDDISAARALLPISFPGVPIFIPTALPGPLAIILAPAHAFARNSASEPLGPLFMTLTLLGDYGWRPAVLDERAWGALRGRAEQQRFLHALLQSWGVVIPTDILQDNDSDSQDLS